MLNAEIAARRQTSIARGVGMQTQIYAAKALNAEVWDVEGTRYIDFAAGIAVVNTGHCHPRVMAAVEKQLHSFTHTCHQVLPYENYIHLGERLNALVPGDFEKRTIFVTTGAEAVENAVKIARAYTQRSAVIAFGGAFHGRTFMGMALTGKVAPYKAGFGAMMPDVYHVPFPIGLHGISTADALAGIEKLFKADLDPARVAAIIFEPVQGEGGFYPAPTDLVRGLRSLCDKHGIVLIADEIQTGFARTGTLFAMEQHGVAADLVTMAKGLAGGLPLAAVTGRAEIMDAANPGGLGGTDGGNPLGIAAAHAVLGYEQLITEDVQFKAEAYYQNLYSQPVEDTTSSAFWLGNTQEWYTDKPLVSKGIGYNAGVELSVEKFFTRGWHALATLSVFESRYRAADGAWYNARFGLGAVANALAGKEWKVGKADKNKVLTTGARYSVQGGQWQTPLDAEASIAAGYELESTALMSFKGDPIHKLDLVLAYRVGRAKVSHEFKADVQNVLNAQTVVYSYYNSSTKRIEGVSQLAILPVMGYTLRF